MRSPTKLDVFTPPPAEAPAADPAERLAAHLAGLIRRGLLTRGDRLPPTRRLARHLGLTRATVLRAYGALAARGLVVSRVGAGTFVDASGSAPAPVPPAIFDWAGYLQGSRVPTPARPWAGPAGTAVDLARAVPDPALAPVAAVRRALRALAARLGPEALDYASPWGYPPLRDRLRRDLALEGIEGEPLLVNGSQQALDLVARLFLRPGDVVALERPGYPGAFRLFRAAGARLLGLPLDEEGLRPDALARALKQEPVRLLYVCPSFQNPTGATMSLERRREVLRLARRAGVPVVEDGCLRELRFEGPGEPSLKGLDREGLVVHVGSYAKSLIPGLRVGWVAAPGPVAARLVALRQDMDLGSVTVAQMLLAELFERGLLGAHHERVREAYRERRDTLVAALSQALPPGCRVIPPAGGMSLWVTLPPEVGSDRVAQEAARRGVLVAPGALFDPEGADPHGFRAAFSAAPPAILAGAAHRLGESVREATAQSQKETGELAPWGPPLV